VRNGMMAVVVGVAVLGCGNELSVAAPTEVARQELTVIRSPTQLETWDWGRRLVPTTAKSAYLVAVADPREPSRFLAWGYDVRSGAALFFVQGKTSADWDRLGAKVKADIGHFQAGGAGFDPGFSWGTASQVYGKPKGPIPLPGANDWSALGTKAFDAAKQIDQQLQGL
jgi:hypothetical protein